MDSLEWFVSDGFVGSDVASMKSYLEICHSATIVHRILPSALSFVASRRGGAYDVRCMMLAGSALNSTHCCSRLLSQCIDISLLERHRERRQHSIGRRGHPQTNADVCLVLSLLVLMPGRVPAPSCVEARKLAL
ncbi:hypothetical protein FVEG_15122 [Fusarium verticillioides 7600]|uniref:Uncharacterized protein n=1 Tax=Gibberella moniliformis (strain M3125 / FGSC 7600) TaxID=334819 RepID=W7LLF8_GIBM7|nr:hypothetical protein FVEG_15122 [Fusarium verticillioides 7600]EWG40233.1 hypothetical protein FVEG_15122 [Fusarium verticillioides 7600]